MQPLSIPDAPLDTVTLVEASAGTGKTYAIAGLYLRLVVEKGIRVPQILVVTYTRAATEELRGRIRQRLLSARNILLGREHTDDPDLRRLLTQTSEDEAGLTLRRLEAALLAFDEAAIYTIHGFCQRVLADTAFASAMPLSTDLVAEESGLLLEIIEDFWRRALFAARPSLVRQVIARWTPASLCKALGPLLGKPYMRLALPDALADLADLAGLETQFQQAFAAAREVWLAEHAGLMALLADSPALNRNKYAVKSLPGWAQQLDAWFDTEDPDPNPPERFAKFTASQLAAGVKKDQPAPQHEFFGLAERLYPLASQLQAAYQVYLSGFFRDLLLYCEQALPRLKRKHKVQAYDDLLLNLHQALHDARGGEALASRLRAHYRAALIDEFQDTDPIQYQIFQRLYADSGQPVFLVGDPKQAIYSFRGADIFAYLQASQAVDARYTLDTNRRSGAALVSAVNTLFATHPAPFLLQRIGFQPVQAVQHRDSSLVLPDDDGAPLQLWFQPPGEDGKAQSKGAMREAAVAAVAGRIVALLNLAEQGQAQIDERALRGSDMAVLVRTNNQAMAVREALLRRGVASVLHSPDSVFDSPEASELERLLAAVLQPRREDLLRAALLSDCLGKTLEDLESLGRDDQAWEALLSRFAGYHQLWREQGFMRMFRRLLVREGVYQRLLGYTEGERRLTNLLHLGELAQAASLDQRLGQEALLNWLLAQREQPAAADDDRQLRLESDAELVQIVTIHKSKGLEYPIVFCPFLWDGHFWSEKQALIQCHDPQDQDRAVLDLGSEQLERRREVAIHEELAEQLRLAYVALTRARERCYVVCGAVSGLEKSALGWLLHPPPVVSPGENLVKAQARFIKSLQAEGFRKGPLNLLKEAPGAIALVEPLPAEAGRYQPRERSADTLQARRFSGIPRLGWCFSSFSALQRRHAAGVADYDSSEGPAEAAAGGSIHAFPRGTRVGRCLHALLERLRFDQPLSEQHSLVEQQLLRHSFDADWLPVISEALQNTLDTPLDKARPWCLKQLSNAERLNELEFVYRMDRLGVNDLQGLLATHGMDAALLGHLDFQPQRGFMRGVIDLLCRVNGRFHLLDYKSNWLGGSAADYHPEALQRAMLGGGYHLQYLIYTVAADRYLRWRVPGYDYARDFAGVYYLFLRGMDGQTPAAGVYFQRPPVALIAALDDYLLLEPR